MVWCHFETVYGVCAGRDKTIHINTSGLPARMFFDFMLALLIESHEAEPEIILKFVRKHFQSKSNLMEKFQI